MATPFTAVRRARFLLSLCLCAVATAALSPAVALASPRPSIAEVQSQLDALTLKADMAIEAYDTVQIELAAAQRRSAAAAAKASQEKERVRALQLQIGALAAAAYRNGGGNEVVSLVTTSDPQTFLDRAGALDQLAKGQSEQLQAVKVATHRLAAAQAQADKELARQRETAQRLSAEQAAIESAVQEQQALLAGLREDEARALAAAQAAAEEAAARGAAERAAADRALADRRAAAAAESARARPVAAPRASAAYYSGPASGRAAVAVQTAYAQLGKPYRWGASGPNSFDCSGLTMYAWGKAGVSLPHSSRAQFSSGQRVSTSSLQPGDLVFYASNTSNPNTIHHVGIYIGNGQQIVAPHTGDVVKIQAAFRGDLIGAVRP